FRVALNAARDVQRSAWRRRVKTLNGAEIMPRVDDAPPGHTLEQKETLQQLRAALMHLRPEEKEVFLLRQNGELTYEQIAELREPPGGTTTPQMRSARQNPAALLGPAGSRASGGVCPRRPDPRDTPGGSPTPPPHCMRRPTFSFGATARSWVAGPEWRQPCT